MRKLRKIKKVTFEELVRENKKELLKDQEALEKIELKLEQKMIRKIQ
ncbi:FbpB family small basic protein [Cytobacillus sp. IB215665]